MASPFKNCLKKSAKKSGPKNGLVPGPKAIFWAHALLSASTCSFKRAQKSAFKKGPNFSAHFSERTPWEDRAPEMSGSGRPKKKSARQAGLTTTTPTTSTHLHKSPARPPLWCCPPPRAPSPPPPPPSRRRPAWTWRRCPGRRRRPRRCPCTWRRRCRPAWPSRRRGSRAGWSPPCPRPRGSRASVSVLKTALSKNVFLSQKKYNYTIIIT